MGLIGESVSKAFQTIYTPISIGYIKVNCTYMPSGNSKLKNNKYDLQIIKGYLYNYLITISVKKT